MYTVVYLNGARRLPSQRSLTVRVSRMDNTMNMYLIPARLPRREITAILDMARMDGYKYALAPFYMGWLVEAPSWWGDTLELVEWV